MPSTISAFKAKPKATFCNNDCMYNLNGCTACGRTGLAVGCRIMGEVKVLSGAWVAAYRECISLEGSSHKPQWAVRLADSGNTVRGGSAIRSWRPTN